MNRETFGNFFWRNYTQTKGLSLTAANTVFSRYSDVKSRIIDKSNDISFDVDPKIVRDYFKRFKMINIGDFVKNRFIKRLGWLNHIDTSIFQKIFGREIVLQSETGFFDMLTSESIDVDEEFFKQVKLNQFSMIKFFDKKGVFIYDKSKKEDVFVCYKNKVFFEKIEVTFIPIPAAKSKRDFFKSDAFKNKLKI